MARADLLWREKGESMEFLIWAAVVVGGSLCILFLYWLPRPEEVEARRSRGMGICPNPTSGESWTHGTQFTAAHGHIAFFGAYAMLIIACAYYALPRWRFGGDNFDQRRGFYAFLFMVVGVLGMTIALTCAGIIQVFMERLWGLPFLRVQGYMSFFYLMRFVFGLLTVAGVGLFFFDLLMPKSLFGKAKLYSSGR